MDVTAEEVLASVGLVYEYRVVYGDGSERAVASAEQARRRASLSSDARAERRLVHAWQPIEQ